MGNRKRSRVVYDIVLKDGVEIRASGENVDEIVRMLCKDDIFIIKENKHPKMVTYIARDRVSHIRLPEAMEGVAHPII